MAFDYKKFSANMQNELNNKKSATDATVDLTDILLTEEQTRELNETSTSINNNDCTNSSKKVSTNTKNRHKSKSKQNPKTDVVSNPKILFTKSPLSIIATPCPRLNSFYKSATKTESFMNKCYNNTFKVNLKLTNDASNIDKGIILSTSNAIDSFYIHFDFERVKDKSSLDKNVILSIENIVYDTSISDNHHLVYVGKVKYNHNLNDNEDFGYFNLKMKFELKNDGNGKYIINRIEISISDFNYVSEMNFIGKFFDFCKNSIDKLGKTDSKSANTTRYNDIDGNLEEIRKFKSSTRSQSVYFSPYKSLKLVQDDIDVEYNIILRYYAQFNLIQCPICNKPIKNLGVPGIVLQAGKSNSEAQLTSNAIFNYLKLLTTKKNLTDDDKKLLQMVYGVITSNIENTEDKDIILHELKLHTDDEGKSMITLKQKDENNNEEELNTDDLKKYTRIPLGELVSFDENNPVNIKIKPFTSKDFMRAKKFLDQFNANTCENYDKNKDYKINNQLYLLKYGKIAPKVDNFNNYLIHDTLITQLCDTCWNPLPQDFYNYDEVITLYYYGNPSAGKTALLCSEYNEIERYNQNVSAQDRIKLNMFNDTHLLDGADSSYYNSSYINKARALKNGQYIVGTNALDIIPGKLSSLTVSVSGKSTDYDIMFNSYDMAGIKSSSRWNSDKNLVYVYSLLDDPLTLGENSLYGKLMNSFTSIGNNSRNYNIQMYLTKIDEYPYFMYKKIQELNNKWTEYAKNDDIDYVKSSMIYTLALLEILESSLKVDFKDKPIEEIISPKLLEIIKEVTKINSFDGLTYYQAHEKIVSVKHYDTIESMDIIGNYLHSLDVMRDSYIKLRLFISSLVDIITNNVFNNRYSLFCFRMYAVSSTGYSKLETENTSINRGELYSPEFIIDAQDVLKHTTYEFVKDKRQCDYSNNLDSYITQLFNPEKCISILDDDFLSSNTQYLSNLRNQEGMSIREFLINRLYSNSLEPSDLYMDNYYNFDVVNNILKNSKEQESIKRLYILYYKNNFTLETNSMVLN